MDIQVRFALFLLLISTNISHCSEMKLQQLVKFDLFSLYNSTLSAYLTKVSVGTPPQTLNVLVDTGSNLSWLYCSDIRLNTFNASESRTASIIYCSKGTACKFSISYYDGSLASGYMVSDLMHFSISPAISPWVLPIHVFMVQNASSTGNYARQHSSIKLKSPSSSLKMVLDWTPRTHRVIISYDFRHVA